MIKNQTPQPSIRYAGIVVVTLRPYQQEAVDAVLASAAKGIRRCLISLPTGSGKTVAFAEIIRRRHGRALVIAHSEELIQQAADKLRMAMPRTRIGIVKAGRDEHDAQVVVASIQTIARANRLERLLTGSFETVVVDECHHARAASFETVLEAVGVFREDGPLLVGVTATPERGDGLGLGKIFQEITYKKSILSMIRAGYLTDLRALAITLDLDLDRIPTAAGDFVHGELEQAMQDAGAPDHAVAAWKEHAEGRKALVFTAGVQQAKATTAAFQAAGVAAASIDGSTSAEERSAILGAFGEGEISVLSNCQVLTEGFDEPSIECLIIARPTKSRGLYAQMVGRGTRRHPGKQDCLILDLAGSTRHKLATVAKLCDIDADVAEHRSGQGVSVLEMVAEEEAIAADGRLRAQVVNLFESRDLRWVRTEAGQWVVPAGDHGHLVLKEAGGSWSVYRVGRDAQITEINSGLDLEYAQGAAEDYVRELGAAIFASPTAAWRSQPASPKQLAILSQRGRKMPPDLTKGEASDMITGSIVQRAMRSA